MRRPRSESAQEITHSWATRADYPWTAIWLMVLPRVSDDFRGLRGFEVEDRRESLAGLLGRAETSDETIRQFKI